MARASGATNAVGCRLDILFLAHLVLVTPKLRLLRVIAHLAGHIVLKFSSRVMDKHLIAFLASISSIQGKLGLLETALTSHVLNTARGSQMIVRALFDINWPITDHAVPVADSCDFVGKIGALAFNQRGTGGDDFSILGKFAFPSINSVFVDCAIVKGIDLLLNTTTLTLICLNRFSLLTVDY